MGSGGQGRRLDVTAPPPALARPAAHVCGGHGKGRVAAGVGSAGDGSACWGGSGAQERLLLVPAPPPALTRPAAGVSGGEGDWCVAAGVGIAGGGCASVGGGSVHRRLLLVPAPPPALTRPPVLLLRGRGGSGRQRNVSGQSRALPRPAAGVWRAEGTAHVAGGVRAGTCVWGVAPVAGVCARISSVAGNAGEPRGVIRIRGRMRGAQK